MNLRAPEGTSQARPAILPIILQIVGSSPTRRTIGAGKGFILSALAEKERAPDLDSLHAVRGQILAAASRRGLREVRVFGSVARGDAVQTSDVDPDQ